MRDKLLTRGEKKAIKRKLNRKLFETFVVWLLNAATQAMGIHTGEPGSANRTPNPSASLNDWKNGCKKLIMKNKVRARARGRSLGYA